MVQLVISTQQKKTQVLISQLAMFPIGILNFTSTKSLIRMLALPYQLQV